MIAFAWYLLKVLICSGILCGYYFLCLRNKIFHRWNRFYLLAAVIISLSAPVIRFDIFQKSDNGGSVVQMLQTISYGDEAVIEYSRSNSFEMSWQNIAECAYLLVSLIFLSVFFTSLYKIIRLRKNYPETKVQNISFINTDARGTPFTFFNSLFWNNAIDLQSKSGQQIFNHEISHIKEKHSYDKTFMNIVLIFFWVNPFFWLMRKELQMIHEFIADKEAMEDNDLNAFAEMVLQTVYPGHRFSLTNNFFYSPIKRRIRMLAKNKNPKVSYVSRLLVLPLAAIVFVAFTLKVKTEKPLPIYDGKPITVVIDAGHGGQDRGAANNGIYEKNVTLAIAKEIKNLNNNKNINIILTREDDEMIPVHDRAKFANEKNADLFISIHIDAEKPANVHTGMDVIVPHSNNKYSEQSKLLGSSVIESFKKNNYPLKVTDELYVRQKGLVILNENSCPAILIETGFLTTTKDFDYITKPDNQKTIAENILNGIENYTMQNSLSDVQAITVADTTPPMYYQNKKVTGLQVQSQSQKIKTTNPVIKVTYNDGTTEMISKEEADKRNFVLPPPPPPGLPPHYFKSDALFVINGEISTNQKAKTVNPKDIESIKILKEKDAVKKYGDKGEKGVIEITTKNELQNVSFVMPDAKTISGLSQNALFIIDGKEATKDEINKIDPGDIESITILKSEAKKIYGEKAKDGVIKITLKNQEEYLAKDTLPGKVFTKVDVEASFPGGPSAWQKYLMRVIKASIDSFTNIDYGTCVLKFIVNTDGTVSNVEATTMRGTRLAKISVNAIRKGPKWIPASQNGKVVAAYRLQPVTLQNPEEKKETSANNQSSLSSVNAENNKVFIKLEQTASFPGGHTAWLKYLSRVFEKNGNELMADKNNQGTCKVRFTVSKEGDISDVRAITMQNTQLAEIAVNCIKKGPKWVPGKQNGVTVNSYVIAPVSFRVNDQIMNEPE